MNLPALPTPQAGLPAHPGPVLHVNAPPQAAQPVWANVSPEQKLELLEYWRSITKRKWALLALTLAVAVLAFVITMAMTPIYRATATVLIEAGKGKIVSVEEVYGNVSQQREHYQTQVEIIKSREVLLRTVQALKLWNAPEFDPRLAKPSWTKRALASLGIGEPIDAETKWTDEKLAAATLRKIQGGGHLTVTPIRLSQLVKVEFEAEDRELAARVANGIADQYIAADRDERYKLTTQVSQQLQDRLASLRKSLNDSEKALQAYREQKGLVNVGGSAQAGTTQQLGGMTERMLQARAKRMELESNYLQAKNAGTTGYASIPAVLTNASVLEAQKLANAAEAKLAELQTRLGPNHEAYKQAQAEVTQMASLLQQRQRAVVQSVIREYEAARNTEVSLERSMNAVRDQAQGVNREEFQLSVLERDYQSNKQLYEMFMNRAKETSLIGDVQPSVARVTDVAVPPETAVKPKRLNIVAVAALLALLLGSLSAVAMDRLDNTVKGGEDAERRLQMPVLTSLPEVEGATRKTMARTFLQNTHSHFAEGIRTARSGILLSALDAPNKVLLITSCVPGEGKTTVAINLGFAHAQSNGRTLLIDLDMRRGQASRALGQGAAKLGVTNLLAGQASIEHCVVPIKETGLHLLPVGVTPPNPLELLLSQRFKDVLAELSKEYPMIIIDSPPVELVSEALVLAPLVTNVALVVRAMSTPAPLVRKTQQRLQRAGGQLLGVIINGLNFKEARAYYGEYAHSSYSYAYDGYGHGGGTDRLEAKGVVAKLKGKMPWNRTAANTPETRIDEAA